ncbi:MAG TPA: 2,3-bisphosphoglycerate-independent phosphoglycerate mutase [Mollicutes bacterium]|nr:2,3-bisphosphoglycerate-independent phosphoglycerate mutase [Mollicutes bacterium]
MKPVVLCILDGVGIREKQHGNAFAKASTPNFDYIWNNYPHTLIEASGELVGLPKNQMGNSEVGHMNIGAGRIVYQPLPFINEQIKNKSFYQNKNILEIINHTKKNNSNLHLLGLVSDGGIHSHIDHLMALIDMAVDNDITNLYLHLFLDGRDTLPDIGLTFLKQVESKLKEVGIGSIATISGRYYSMDRDNRWDRVELAYKAIVNGIGESYQTVEESIENNLNRGITDEFVIPAVLDEKGVIKEKDGLIAFNFRPDRLKQLFTAITNPKFDKFDRIFVNNLKLVTMMPTSDEIKSVSAFVPEKLDNTLGEYISYKGFSQLRIAETEKYAHVTYFFDGGQEKKIPGCKHLLIPSPKVTTYDLKPEMSVYEITEGLLKELNNDYDLVVLNYANGDMVGHTGNFEAAVKGIEAVDKCLGKIYSKVTERGGTLIITADHGNCEYMIDENNNIITSHTTNKVPFIITNKSYELKEGCLGDIAPTILEILNLEKPKEMTRNSLIKRINK